VPLDHQWIEQHIAHQGRMCLLEEVLSWDARSIRCRSATHRAADNPLRAHGRLGAACGIEYAAQAMAVHGALVAASAPLVNSVARNVRGSIGTTLGYLASVRNVALYVARLDDLEADLITCAERVTGDARTVLYEFSVWHAMQALLRGRASIVFDERFGASSGVRGAHA
jgi:predicted hotdog family 3-hydroxylacyl-ACP dehydratase